MNRMNLVALPSTQTGANEETILSVPMLAKYLGMSQNWVYRAAAEGRIPHRKIGSRLVFRRSEIEAWIDKQPGVGLVGA